MITNKTRFPNRVAHSLSLILSATTHFNFSSRSHWSANSSLFSEFSFSPLFWHTTTVFPQLRPSDLACSKAQGLRTPSLRYAAYRRYKSHAGATSPTSTSKRFAPNSSRRPLPLAFVSTARDLFTDSVGQHQHPPALNASVGAAQACSYSDEVMYTQGCRPPLEWSRKNLISLCADGRWTRCGWLTRWPPWSFINPSDIRVYINLLFLFCHCVFIYSDFHWQLFSLLCNGSQYCFCLIAES